MTNRNLKSEKISSRSRHAIIAVVVAGVVGCPPVVQAQGVSDTASLYSGMAFSVAALVILILAVVLVKRLSVRRKNELSESSGLDLMGMRQKNLLTPEEMKMVSAAIARKMAEKDARGAQVKPGLSTASLLHDPEVVRLQELARAKREAEQSGGRQVAEVEDAVGGVLPGRGAADPGLAGGSGVNSMAAEYDPIDPIPPDFQAGVGGGVGGGAEGNAADLDDDLGDVVLPPEVQQLADAGLLSAEEIENVRRRIKARK